MATSACWDVNTTRSHAASSQLNLLVPSQCPPPGYVMQLAWGLQQDVGMLWIEANNMGLKLRMGADLLNEGAGLSISIVT